MPTLLLLVPDLMFGTRIEQAARGLGYVVENAAPGSDFDALLARVRPDLVLFTLDRTGDDWPRLLEAARRAGVSAVAFGSHRDAESFRRARELGALDVVANSRLAAALPQLLSGWLARSA